MTKRADIFFRSWRAIAVLFLAPLAGGCAFTTYQSHSAAAPAKPDNYPIQIYTQEMKIPRPCELLGTVSFHAGKFTMFGGSSDKELAKVLQMARQKGADVVRVTDVKKPDFANPNYRLTAQLLRYSDSWETIPFSRNSFPSYLAHQQELDPIEGVWLSDIVHGQTIGIKKDNSKPDRDFVGFILESANPAWTVGMKKMDIRRGSQPNTYILTYYLDDFSPREVPIILTGKKDEFAISIYTGENSDDQDIVTYAKFQ